MSANKTIKYNSVKVDLILNPQYDVSSFSNNDTILKNKVINIEPVQIKELVINKSYATNVTDVRLDLVNMDSTVCAHLSEGKYLVRLLITAQDTAVNTTSAINHFIVEKLFETGYGKLAGTYPVVNATLILKSVTRVRLEIENNFPYTLGGKGTTIASGHPAAVGQALTPLEFFTQVIMKEYTSTYYPYTSYDKSTPIFNLSQTSRDPRIVINKSPTQSGFKMEADTNLETLQVFHKHFPMFRTPYDWLLDDLPTDTQQNDIYVKDFVAHESWKALIDPTLSELLGGKKPIDSSAAEPSREKELVDQYALANLGITNRATYFNTSKFLFRDYLPRIFARSISDNNPILTTEWNADVQRTSVLASDGSHLVIKLMDNPMWKQYLTFLAADDLELIQKYYTVFMMIHPDFVTYEFKDVFVGDVDIHKTVHLLKENLSDDETYGYNRVGTGYQVEHRYVRVQRDTSTIPDGTLTPTEQQMYEPSFKMSSKLTMLYVDERDISKIDFETLSKNRAFVSTEYDPLNYYDFIDIDNCGQPTGDGDISQMPYAKPGSPGNEDIAAAAKTLIDKGFAYRLGAANSRIMDCSAFTMFVLANSGGASGRKTNYPNGTSAQYIWLTTPSNGAQRVPKGDPIQAGDILFFRSGTKDHGHTGIAKNGTQFYHASSSGSGNGLSDGDPNQTTGIGASTGTILGRSANYSLSHIFRLRPLKEK